MLLEKLTEKTRKPLAAHISSKRQITGAFLRKGAYERGANDTSDQKRKHYSEISVAYVGQEAFESDIKVCNALAHCMMVPNPDNLQYGVDSPVSKALGNTHVCSTNLMNDVSEKCSVVPDGGAVVSMSVLGMVVTHPMTINTVKRGDETALVNNSHGGMPMQPDVTSLQQGTIACPMNANDPVVAEVVTNEKMCSAHTEMAGNLLSGTVDTEKHVETVYCYEPLSAADVIPMFFMSSCLTEYGVDTAAYLSLKRTGGYGVGTGGAATDVGMPNRCNLKPVSHNELDCGHYGSCPVYDSLSNSVPTSCSCIAGSCNQGLMSVFDVVRTPSQGAELPLSCVVKYLLNVSKAVEPSVYYLKAVRACHLLSMELESVRKHSLDGVGGTAAPGAKGGSVEVCKSADVALSPLTSVNAGDVKSSTTYLVLIMYLQALDEEQCKQGSQFESTCSLTGSEYFDDTSVVSLEGSDVTGRVCVDVLWVVYTGEGCVFV